MNGGISLSRNASSSSLKATSSGDQAKSTNLTLPSGWRYRPGSYGLHVLARAGRAARRGARVPRGRGAEGVRAAHGRARRRRRHARGVAQDRRPRLDGPARARSRPAGSGSGSSTRSSCRRRWAARCSPARSSRRRSSRRSRRARSASTTSSPRSPAGTQRGTVALDEAGYGDPIERVHVRADGRGTRYKLDGVKPMVPDGCTADWVLVPARTREGLQTFLVERPANAQLVAEPRRHPQVRALRVRRDARRCSSVRPATTPTSGAASPTTPAVLLAAELIGVSEAANAARARLRAGARGVRQAALEVPGDAAQGRRHAARDRDRARRRALRGVGVRRRRRRSRDRGRDGEGVRRATRPTTSPPSASRSTAASATRGSTTRTCSCAAPRSTTCCSAPRVGSANASPTNTSQRSEIL